MAASDTQTIQADAEPPQANVEPLLANCWPSLTDPCLPGWIQRLLGSILLPVIGVLKLQITGKATLERANFTYLHATKTTVIIGTGHASS